MLAKRELIEKTKVDINSGMEYIKHIANCDYAMGYSVGNRGYLHRKTGGTIKRVGKAKRIYHTIPVEYFGVDLYPFWTDIAEYDESLIDTIIPETRDYKGMNRGKFAELFNDVVYFCENAIDEFDDYKDYEYRNKTEVLNTYIHWGLPLTKVETIKISKALNSLPKWKFTGTRYVRESDNELYAMIMSIITGETFSVHATRGVCQRDYQEIIVPSYLVNCVDEISCLMWCDYADLFIDNDYCRTVLGCEEMDEVLDEIAQEYSIPRENLKLINFPSYY